MSGMNYTSRDYEELIKKINGVRDCQVFVCDDGSIGEIHVVAQPGRSRTHIVRDVQSVLIASCGTRIDSRNISVLHIDDYGTERSVRLRLIGIELTVSERKGKVRVKMDLGETSVVGEAEGIPSATRWNWLCAEAAVSALRKFLREDVMISIMDVRVVESRPLKTILVTLQVSEGGKDTVLSGSCPISCDERQAVVKATLDAINRRFPLLAEMPENFMKSE